MKGNIMLAIKLQVVILLIFVLLYIPAIIWIPHSILNIIFWPIAGWQIGGWVHDFVGKYIDKKYSGQEQ
jgi:hypothetical protein